MVKNLFDYSDSEGLTLLLLGAHCDDIEIGCGGTLLNLIDNYNIKQVKWVVFASNETRREEAIASAQKVLEGIANKEIKVLDYKDGYLPSVWSAIKDEFETIKENFTPDIIFTHYRNDLHQDHRVVNELTWNTFRNHLIYEYEIPKYDGDLGTPNVFAPLDEKTIVKKRTLLKTFFKSQLDKHWFDDSLINAVMRIRGVECASPTNYAEAFHCRKMTI